MPQIEKQPSDSESPLSAFLNESELDIGIRRTQRIVPPLISGLVVAGALFLAGRANTVAGAEPGASQASDGGLQNAVTGPSPMQPLGTSVQHASHASHGSHGSHYSHGSHGSHGSHYSHGSHGSHGSW